MLGDQKYKHPQILRSQKRRIVIFVQLQLNIPMINHVNHISVVAHYVM